MKPTENNAIILYEVWERNEYVAINEMWARYMEEDNEYMIIPHPKATSRTFYPADYPNLYTDEQKALEHYRRSVTECINTLKNKIEAVEKTLTEIQYRDKVQREFNYVTQKFERGDKVRVAKDLGSMMRHFPNDFEALIEYSSDDMYADERGIYVHDFDIQYSLMYEQDNYNGKGDSRLTTTAWYHQNQLTLIERGSEQTIKDFQEKWGVKYKPIDSRREQHKAKVAQAISTILNTTTK